MKKLSERELDAVVGGNAAETAEFYAACQNYLTRHPDIAAISYTWCGES